MLQSALFETPRYTVTEFTRRVRRLLEGDPALADAWVQAEVSNFSRPASGHLYFTLKDSGASLRCVMWKGDAARIRGLSIQDGLSVEVHGKITVYEPSGQYQLVVDLLRPAGEGALFAEFMRLKGVLEDEGLFAPERKRVLDNFPRTIGIVTSPTGAALQDMLNILRRRLPLAQVVLAAAPVQGHEAPAALIQAIEKLNTFVRPDVILLARGGGSIEDLWAFNDERVVRAVVASQAPIITGVGHETDFTLVDFAADKRAPTPTAAAELATPITIIDLAAALQGDVQRLDEAINRQIAAHRTDLESIQMSLRYYSPVRRLQTESQRLDDLMRRLVRAQDHRLTLEAAHLKGTSRRLESLSPLAVLRRGYAVVTRSQDEKIVQTASQAPVGSELHVRLAEGDLDVNVKRSTETRATLQSFLEEA
ncbi:MAG: exodeoxyribonuclease VII large subunit [Chloroflexi bacterium]|nr:exodeoxyribonuclease VII large subunit [Chloroflexota bacterium]